MVLPDDQEVDFAASAKLDLFVVLTELSIQPFRNFIQAESFAAAFPFGLILIRIRIVAFAPYAFASTTFTLSVLSLFADIANDFDQHQQDDEHDMHAEPRSLRPEFSAVRESRSLLFALVFVARIMGVTVFEFDVGGISNVLDFDVEAERFASQFMV